MTVVAARRLKDGVVEISADDQTTFGHHKFDVSTGVGDSKVFDVNGILAGCAGDASEANLFKLFCNNHKPKTAGVDSIIEFMYEFRDWVAKKTGDEKYELCNSCILVYEGRIFEVYSGDACEKKDFWAIGSGMFLALAALHLGKSTKEAVDVAKIYDLYCGGETITLQSKRKK